MRSRRIVSLTSLDSEIGRDRAEPHVEHRGAVRVEGADDSKAVSKEVKTDRRVERPSGNRSKIPPRKAYSTISRHGRDRFVALCSSPAMMVSNRARTFAGANPSPPAQDELRCRHGAARSRSRCQHDYSVFRCRDEEARVHLVQALAGRTAAAMPARHGHREGWQSHSGNVSTAKSGAKNWQRAFALLLRPPSADHGHALRPAFFVHADCRRDLR